MIKYCTVSLMFRWILGPASSKKVASNNQQLRNTKNTTKSNKSNNKSNNNNNNNSASVASFRSARSTASHDNLSTVVRKNNGMDNWNKAFQEWNRVENRLQKAHASQSSKAPTIGEYAKQHIKNHPEMYLNILPRKPKIVPTRRIAPLNSHWRAKFLLIFNDAETSTRTTIQYLKTLSELYTLAGTNKATIGQYIKQHQRYLKQIINQRLKWTGSSAWQGIPRNTTNGSSVLPLWPVNPLKTETTIDVPNALVKKHLFRPAGERTSTPTNIQVGKRYQIQRLSQMKKNAKLVNAPKKQLQQKWLQLIGNRLKKGNEAASTVTAAQKKAWTNNVKARWRLGKAYKWEATVLKQFSGV